jgi:hypothetical protein
MSWVGGKDFASRFYFRGVPDGKVELRLIFESAEPVWLNSLTVHAASDCMVQGFEHGLVLANPSDHPWRIDLGALAPGGRFRRLQGVAGQDRATNNGQPVEGVVTLGPRDALFLRR